jgi:hypothetical protein
MTLLWGDRVRFAAHWCCNLRTLARENPAHQNGAPGFRRTLDGGDNCGRFGAEIADAFADGVFELVDAEAGDGGDGVERELAALGHRFQFFELGGIGGINFGGDDDHGLLVEAVAEAFEFFHDDAEIFDGVGTAVGVGDVDEMDEDASALDVAEKLDAESCAEVRAFDEAGDVGDYIAFFIGRVADGDDAELRLEGGEGVVGNFGAGGGDAGDEGGFANVGIADEADVGEDAELEAVIAFFTGATEFVLARSLMRGGGEVLIAAAAASAAGDDETLVGTGEVVDELAGIGVEEHGANGDFEDGVFAVMAGAVGTHAVLAALALVLGVVAEVDQGVVALAGFKDDAAAVTAITTGGSAAGNELFPAKGHAAITAVTGFDPNFGFIDKHSL